MSEAIQPVSRHEPPLARLPVWFYLASIYAVAMLTAVAVTRIDQPVYVLAAAFGIPALAAIFLKPELGMLALVFVTFTRAFEVITGKSEGVLSIYTVYLALLAVVIFARWLFFGEKTANWRSAAILIGLFGLMGVASLLYADYTEVVRIQLLQFVKDFLMLLLVVMLIKSGRTLRSVIWTLLGAGIFLGTITLYQQATGDFANTFFGFGEVQYANIVDKVQGNRIGGPGLDPNTYGQYMLVLVPLAWDRLWNERRLLLRLLAGWAFIVTTLSIIFSFSRGNFIGLVAVLGLLVLLKRPNITTIAIALVLGMFMLPFIPAQYTQRITTLTYIIPNPTDGGDESMGSVRNATREISFRGRLSENIVGLLMTRDNPIIGVGLGNYKDHYQSYSRGLGLDSRREGRSAHNLYLEISSEFGLIGVAWFLLLNWVAFRSLLHARRQFLEIGRADYAAMTTAITVSLIGLLVTSIFLHMVYPRYFWLVYALVLAVPNAANHDQDEHFVNSAWKVSQEELNSGSQYAY
jgi:O-antigen ligase